MSLSFGGLIALCVIILASSVNIAGESIQILSYRFVVRVSLPIFMQVFAYFFLRLYRYGLFEIKYFQNEITSAQLRIIALETILMKGSKETIEKFAL